MPWIRQMSHSFKCKSQKDEEKQTQSSKEINTLLLKYGLKVKLNDHHDSSHVLLSAQFTKSINAGQQISGTHEQGLERR